MSGYWGLRAAAADPRLAAPAAFEGVTGDFDTIFGRAQPAVKRNYMYMSGFRDEERFDRELAALLPLGDLVTRLTRPVLLGIGEFDELTPLEQAPATYERIPAPKEMRVYENEPHPPGRGRRRGLPLRRRVGRTRPERRAAGARPGRTALRTPRRHHSRRHRRPRLVARRRSGRAGQGPPVPVGRCQALSVPRETMVDDQRARGLRAAGRVRAPASGPRRIRGVRAEETGGWAVPPGTAWPPNWRGV